MKFTIRLVGAIWLSVLIVIGGFAFLQIREERERLLDDLKRRAVLVGEGLKEAIEPQVARGSTVVDRDPTRRPAELLEDALDADRRAARDLRLDRLLEPLAHEDGAALQIVEEPLALLADLQEREPPDDDQHREPDGSDEANGEFHGARPRPGREGREPRGPLRILPRLDPEVRA